MNRFQLYSFYDQYKTSNMTSNFIRVIRAGYNYGQKKIGVEIGPKFLFNEHLFYSLNDNKINYYIDSTHRKPEPLITKIYEKAGRYKFSSTPNEKYIKYVNDNMNDKRKPFDLMRLVANSNKKLYDLNLTPNAFRLNLVGDHSGVIGSVAASVEMYKNIVLVWIDAHTDINTPETSMSGNIHGMPVSILTGMTPNLYKTHFDWISQFVNPSNILYIGVRDIDAAEERIIKEHKIAHIKAFDFVAKSQSDIIYRIQQFVAGRDVHISFDIDAFDPKFIQCTGTPVASGLYPNQVKNILTTIRNNSKVKALDVTEFNPLIKSEKAHDNAKTIVDNVILPMILQ